MRPAPDRQGGYGLLLVMLLSGMVGLLLLNKGAKFRNSPEGQSASTARALAQAKAALIAYAATYPDSHEGETFGYLPLPDMGGDVDNLNRHREGWAASSFAGNAKDITLIGRFPWFALRLSPLKDGAGECLWYAVSGNFKQNPKTDFLNWDTQGYLDLRSADGGTAIWPGSAHDRPVATIFSPGPHLGDQRRTHSVSPDDNVSLCGGNYEARNYLDNGTDWTNVFPGSTHSGIDSRTNQLKQLRVASSGAQDSLNDRAVFITAGEIFDAVKRRRDFAGFINYTVIPGAVPCIPQPGARPRKGKATEVCTSHPANQPAAKWWDQFFFLVCAVGANCLSVNGQTCQAALLFGGERASGQLRPPEGRSDPANFLEETLTAYRAFDGGPTILTGAAAYPGVPASRDVVRCVY